MIGLDAPARRAQDAAGGELVAGAVRAVQPLALHVLDLVVTDLLGEREREEERERGQRCNRGECIS